MNGLMLYGIKSAALETIGVKKLTAEEMALTRRLDTKARESLKEERMIAREGRVRQLRSSFDAELERLFGAERGAVFRWSTTGAGSCGIGSGSISISIDNYRKLWGIIRTLLRTGVELSVESVILRLEKLGMRSQQLLSADIATIETAIKDVKREDMTAEEIAFADEYLLYNESSELTNYELREYHRRGYTIEAETGSLIAPTGRAVDFRHEFLPEELRSKSIDFNRKVDFESDSELMALVEARQKLREEIAAMRREIKERKARGEEIPGTEMDAFNKAANEVGLYSEQIAERSLQKYLEGEGFIQVYPEIGAASPKSGDFDRIYIKEQNGRYAIFELKGGISKIGDRVINDVVGIRKGSIAEQGTLPYLQQILFEMGKREATKEMAQNLTFGLREGNVDYLYFRQGFDEGGKLKNPEIGQFDLSEKGSH
jgi:hypothetical protein